jgi:hypothetical protein
MADAAAVAVWGPAAAVAVDRFNPPVKVYMAVVQASDCTGSFRLEAGTEVSRGSRVPRDYSHQHYGYSAVIGVLPGGIEKGFLVYPTSAAVADLGGMNIKTPVFSLGVHQNSNRSPLGEFLLRQEHGTATVRDAVLRRLNPSIRQRHVKGTTWKVMRRVLGVPEAIPLTEDLPLVSRSGRPLLPVLVGIRSVAWARVGWWGCWGRRGGGGGVLWEWSGGVSAWVGG